MSAEKEEDDHMNREELKDLMRGIIVATPTPFDDNFEIDHGKMANLTDWWVDSGLVEGKAVIKCVSVMGEVSQLADDEWPFLVRTVARAANGKVPVIGGIHGKDTKRSIDDAKRAQEMGAIGIQVSPPLFNDPNQDDILRYFQALSDGIEIGIMIYNNPWYPHGEIMADTFMKMADFEHVVAIKWCQPRSYEYGEMEALAPHFNILENGTNLAECFRLGGVGFLDEQATAYPQHELDILAFLEAGKYDEGQALWDSVTNPLRDVYVKMTERSGGQARLKKAVMEAMGMPIGSMRPPSLPHSEDELDELRGLMRGFGWPVP